MVRRTEDYEEDEYVTEEWYPKGSDLVKDED